MLLAPIRLSLVGLLPEVVELSQLPHTLDEAEPAPGEDSASGTNSSKPMPVRPFTIQADGSPFPSGSGMMDTVVVARSGLFWLPAEPTMPCDENLPCSLGNGIVLWVDCEGRVHRKRT